MDTEKERSKLCFVYVCYEGLTTSHSYTVKEERRVYREIQNTLHANENPSFDVYNVIIVGIDVRMSMYHSYAMVFSYDGLPSKSVPSF